MAQVLMLVWICFVLVCWCVGVLVCRCVGVLAVKCEFAGVWKTRLLERAGVSRVVSEHVEVVVVVAVVV